MSSNDYVMICQVATDHGLEQQFVAVDRACRRAWLRGDSDDLYHYLPQDTQAVIDVVSARVFRDRLVLRCEVVDE